MNMKPLPALPTDFGGQPRVVSAWNDIRFTIRTRNAQICLVAREYLALGIHCIMRNTAGGNHKKYKRCRGFEKQLHRPTRIFFNFDQCAVWPGRFTGL